MPSYAGNLKRLRMIADDPNVSVSSHYAEEAEKVIYPKKRGEKDGQHEYMLKQLESEYQEAYAALKPKIAKYLTRLRLYNNQMRQEDAVGDSSLFTNHQTVIASLYYDRLGVEYDWREEGDEEAADNMNALCEFDYEEMWKPWNDYQWDWDAGFYGWGLKWMYEFDRKSKTPVQQVWDPASFLRDPRAESVNGDRMGAGAMRFGGLEVFMTMREMEANPEYFNLDRLRTYGKGDYNTLSYEADRARRTAQGISGSGDQAEGENEQYCILRWLTHIRIGGEAKKCIVETGNERGIIIRITPLETDYWPLVKRDMFPMSHSWDGVSICDLTEDKQRGRAGLINTILKSARADVEPMYLFDQNKVNANTDFKFGFNKFIPINGPVGENVVLPLRKAQPGTVASFVLDYLDSTMQRALATPELRLGVPSKDQRTLGETQLMNAGVDTRYSLTARVWGWSEKEEWRMYYDNYLRNLGEGIDRKIVRLTGLFNHRSKPITRESIKASHPLGLDIKIESKEISAAKKRVAFQQLGAYLGSALQEPSADRLYSLRFYGKQAFPRDVVERMLPLTVDERIAQRENESLDRNEPVAVRLEDNHDVHFRENAKAKDTPAAREHLRVHEDALILKRQYPQLFPMMPEDMRPGGSATAMAAQGPAMANQSIPAAAESTAPLNSGAGMMK